MSRFKIALSLVSLVCAWSSSTARAATCVLQGTVRIESMDTFYCDPDILGTAACSSWIETDLDDKTGNAAPPMKNAMLLLSKDGALLSSAITSSTGAYSFSFQAASCNGNNMRVHVYFDRRDPADVGKGTFRIVDDSDLTLSTFRDFLLSGTPATRDIIFTKGNNANLITKAPSVYHTVNSAIDQMRTWSSNLAARLKGAPVNDGTGSVRIRFSSSVTGTAANRGTWMVKLQPQDFSAGGSIRHELGHIAHYALHGRNLIGNCESYALNTYFNDGHSAEGCEYGQVASVEGLASFFGARSLRTNDGDNAVLCECSWRDEASSTAPSNQDICSEIMNGPLSADDDRMTGCTGGLVVGLGDSFASSSDHCIRLLAGTPTGQSGRGCACPDLNFDGICDFNTNLPQTCPDANHDGVCDTFKALGFRNEFNVARFMWDVLDSNNESGLDDTDTDIQTLALNFQAMPCTGTTASRGVNGDCNEANPPPGWCLPINEGDFFTGSMTGTRDAYNAADFEVLIPLSQSAERTLNCVDQAN